MATVSFTLNGQLHVLKSKSLPTVYVSLLQYIRDTALLKGTKCGCGIGGCGACTVMVSRKHDDGTVSHSAINSCITPVLALDGAAVTTIEGIGDSNDPHPIQDRIVRLHGSQCGFCTPGMVMSLFALLRSNPSATAEELEAAYNGNICRCTGYRPLLDAAKSFAIDIEDVLAKKEQHDQTGDAAKYPPLSKDAVKRVINTGMKRLESVRGENFKLDNQAAEVALPPITLPPRVGQAREDCLQRFRSITGNDGTSWLMPSSISEVYEAQAAFPDAKILGGNAGFCGVLKLRSSAYAPPEAVMWMGDVRELHDFKFDEGTFAMTIGAAVTCQVVLRKLHTVLCSISIKNKPALQREMLLQIHDALASLMSTQLRSGTTVVGAMMPRPCGDLVPLLVTLRSELLVSNRQSATRTVPVKEFCTSGGCMLPGDVVVAVRIPSDPQRYTACLKIAPRVDNCPGTLCVAMGCHVLQREGQSYIEDVELITSGASHFILPLQDAARALEHTSLLSDFGNPLRTACDSVLTGMRNEMHPNADGKMSYRITIARGAVFRLFSHLQEVLNLRVMPSVLEGQEIMKRSITLATQSWETTRGNIHNKDHTIREGVPRSPVGDPQVNIAGIQQATGEATYVDDIPKPDGCLYAALVKSTIPHGTVDSVSTTIVAESEPDFVSYIDYSDIPVKPKVKDFAEHSFANSEVSYVGDVIGVCVAKDPAAAKRCAERITVSYTPLPAIFTIEEAIEKGSFAPFGRSIVDGDPDTALKNPRFKILRGVLNIGGQEHFYLEPHALLVSPIEGNGMDVHTMTQCVTKTQSLVAKLLGIPQAKVKVHVRRIGGAFGGKETRATYTAGSLAVAAAKLKRPIAWLADRSEDMRITGGRHPFRAEWSVAVSKDERRIVAIDVKLYANAGWSDCVTPEVIARGLMHITNAYKIPNVRVEGFCAITNVQSHTAFRGFGAPQAMLVMENIVEAVAQYVALPVESIQRSHLMRQGELTHFGQEVPHCRLTEMWGRLFESSSYANRCTAVDMFNSSSRWVKRGIAVTPTMYGISFPVRHLCQGEAYVCVYTDGTVFVSHGAVEMGQGVNTKVAQCAAQVFGIPVSSVNIGEASSDQTPNAPPTAASMGSDLSCMAVLDACCQIHERLKPFISAAPKASFKEICDAAWRQRVPLFAEGHYATSRGGQYDYTMETRDNTKRGPQFSYFVFGICASEVEVDILSGRSRVLRADLLMDCGDSLNPAVDIGQVEGSYIQSLGWFTKEDLQYGDSKHPNVPPGTLSNASPLDYLVPGPFDVPLDFRVELLSGAPNASAVHGSKAVGEPPQFLAASVFFAIKKAIYSARHDEGISGFLSLDSPLTPERIRMACRDEFTLGTFHDTEYLAALSV